MLGPAKILQCCYRLWASFTDMIFASTECYWVCGFCCSWAVVTCKANSQQHFEKQEITNKGQHSLIQKVNRHFLMSICDLQEAHFKTHKFWKWKHKNAFWCWINSFLHYTNSSPILFHYYYVLIRHARISVGLYNIIQATIFYFTWCRYAI